MKKLRKSMELKVINHNGESIIQVALYGKNRSEKVVEMQEMVFNKFNFPINYFKYPIPNCSYGMCLDDLTAKLCEKVDYIYYWDIDSCPIKKNYFEIIYNKISDHSTLVGCAFRNMHKKKSPTWEFDFVNTGPPVFLSMKLYKSIGKPSLDHMNERSDTFEELGYQCKSRGYPVCIYYPRSVVGLTAEDLPEMSPDNYTAPLGEGLKFGYGCDYGGLFWHQFFANATHHVRDFTNKCSEILENS